MNDILDEKYEIAIREKWSTSRIQKELLNLHHETRKKLMIEIASKDVNKSWFVELKERENNNL